MVRLVCVTAAVLALGGIRVGAQAHSEADSHVQSMTGAVIAVSASSLTVARAGNEMRFEVDSATRVLARGGAGSKVRDLVFRPGSGPRFTDVVKTGDQVTVRYRRSGSAIKAVEVRLASERR